MPPRKIIKPAETPGVEAEPEIASTAVALVAPITDRPTFIDLLVFPQKEASLKIITERRSEYDKVTISGVDDKLNYNLVVQQMSQMRDDRRAFENAAYANVIDPLKDKLKEYAADIDEVVEAFKAAEKAERDKKDFIDNEKKRIKLEKEEARARAVQVRISDLTRLGALFDGACYTFPYDSGLLINSLQVSDFEDDEWGEFLADVNLAYEAEQVRLNKVEADRLKQIEDDRLKALEITAQAKQNQADELKLAEKRKVLRVKELKLVGAVVQDDETYFVTDKPGLHLPPLSVLIEMPDEEWEALIQDIENFVPETKAVVNDILEVMNAGPNEMFINHTQKQLDGELIASELGLGDHVELDFKEESLLEVKLIFSSTEPYTEFPISSKLHLRVYPDEFSIESLAGVNAVANEGKLQGLNWIIFSKQK